jgi:hypothetical protein
LPSGFSRLCSGPAPKPSSEIEKPATRTFIISTLLYPKLLHSPARHSHSMVLSDHNALTWQNKFFPRPIKNRLPIRRKFALLNSREDFADRRFSRFRRLSASIGRFLKSPTRITSLAWQKKDRQPLVIDRASSHRGRDNDLEPFGLSSPVRQLKRSFVKVPPPISQSCPASCPRAPEAHWQVASRFPAPAAAF